MSNRSEPTGDRVRDLWYRRCVAVITVVGATWRVTVLVSKWNVLLRLNDSLYYSIQASNNARGKWFREAGGAVFQNWGVLPGAEHPPLTSLVITPASLLSNPQFWQRATMTALGIAVVPLIALLARRAGGRRGAVIAAAIAAVYPNVWMSDALVMSETLLLLMVVLTMLAALRYRDRFDVRSALLLAVVIGVAGHARSETLLYAPLFALVGVRRGDVRRWAARAALILLVTGVTVVPWIAYNSSRFNATVLMSTNAGGVLVGANCPLAYSGPALGGWDIRCLDEGPAPAGEDTAQRSVRWRHQAVTYARAHLGRLPVVAGARLLRAVDLYGLADTARGDVGEERPAWGVWSGVVCWWTLAPMAAVALWRTRRGLRYVLLVPVVGVGVVTLVFYGSHRLRAPLEPVLVVAAAMFITGLGPVRTLIDNCCSRLWSLDQPSRKATSQMRSSSPISSGSRR